MNPGNNNQAAGPAPADPLAALRDIHLPVEPGWWPPAPGWWVLLLLVLMMLYWSCRALYRRWRQGAPYRQYRQALLDIDIDEKSSRAAIAAMSRLTRQFVISIYGREGTASLTGIRWLGLLDKHAGAHSFTDGPGMILEAGPYSTSLPDQQSLLALRQTLLKLARRQARPERVSE